MRYADEIGINLCAERHSTISSQPVRFACTRLRSTHKQMPWRCDEHVLPPPMCLANGILMDS